MKQHKKCIFGILLSFALMLTVLGLSQTALAWEGDPYASLVNTTTVVKFDSKDWYLIENNSTAVNAGTVTLLSKECVAKSKYDSSYKSNTYSGSTVETAVNDYYTNNISSDAKTAVVDNKMFLLTKDQAKAMTNDARKCSQTFGTSTAFQWWLCSPGQDNLHAACVDCLYGEIFDDGNYVDSTQTGVRPALQLDLSKVAFDSESKTFSIPTLYPLWVGETQVTSENMSGEGWSYTPASGDTPAKLALNNYTYEGEGYNNAAIYAKEDLVIETTGTNNVKNTATPGGTRVIDVTGNLTFQGSGTLNATGGSRSIIANTVTVERGTVSVSGGRYGIYAFSGEEGNITINGGVVNASAEEIGLQAANDVIIKNGTVIATNTNNDNIAIYADKNITIEGGNVEATGIVGIYAYEGKLMIKGGVIRATGNSAGIGGLTVTINNGTIEAKATDDRGAYGIFGASEVTINDGQVTASGSTAGISGFVKNSIAGTGWTNTAGTEGKADIAVSAETGQNLSNYKKVQFPTAHTHIFTYTASGATITAKCTASGCTLPESSQGAGDHVATLTIAAPLHTTYGDGEDAAAQITDANSIQGATKVQYQKKTGESYETATETAPTDAGDYKASITLGPGTDEKTATASVEYTIAQKPVTVSGITAENKEYDGNTDASLNFDSATISGIEGVDNVALSTTSAKGAFSDKKAENGKTVTITGLALTGADASNYVLSSQPTTTANITKLAVTVTGITASNKVYDGTISATVNCGSAVINGKVDNDDLTFTAPTGSFSDKTVGEDKTVSFSGLALSGADAANYSLSAQPADTTANITAKPVTITGVTAEDKEYDGNRTATAITAKAVIDEIVGNDDLSFVPGTGSFSDKNVGNNKTVSFSGFALSGNDSANYTLASQPADTTADITAKEVKVSGIKAENKTYDGTTDATLDCTSASFDGKLDSDTLNVTATGAFEDANAGQDKTVNISGLTLGGTDKANYVLAAEGQQTTDQADIAQKSITGATVTLDKTQLTYNGQEQSVSVTGVTTSDGMTLTANDYEIVSGNTGTDIGDYTVIIEGKGNYKDEATADWKIVEKVSPTPTPTPQPAKISGTEMAKMTAKGNTKMAIAWSKIQGADGYDIFFARCNHNGKKVAFKKVKTIKGNKTFKWTATKLKKNTSYKAYVKAYTLKNGKKTYVRTSPMLHVYTGNASGKYTNAKSVTVNKAKVSLKKGKTFKIKAKVNKIKKNKKLMPKSHVATLRYLTSNKKVATVSKSGKITAKGKGSCVVYVYAHNGVSKSIKVTVS